MEVEIFHDLHNSWASFHHTAHYCQHADWQGYPKLRNRSQTHHLHSILIICRVPFGATKGIEEQAVIFEIINCLKETASFPTQGSEDRRGWSQRLITRKLVYSGFTQDWLYMVPFDQTSLVYFAFSQASGNSILILTVHLYMETDHFFFTLSFCSESC